ncbi:gamma-glutamyltransferase [Spirosoma utsteinense]|uniref:Glutathione hydrolase proenzyme n=1 Tax=Spirosoma utsteinense TaxID=2585773 RepID=A0ABR6W416_9BACT|nr:gamma-glutamyltransferase [Spirosoma utsteinense]MBC3787120.1 gamma-glutamyltranspeptidase/glutathione hydrolase [Spirosoma utsteinense]MBC3791330.1 gamma-glutamyltranspeptidase/glutathione hydrolase [Spirosoma utsteinense]
MKRQFRVLPLLALTLLAGCKSQSPTTTSGSGVRQGLGVYEYRDEDPSVQPFFSDRQGVIGRNGMVASAHPEASQVGLNILKAGGNAVDAAVAVQFALAVVYPGAGNIGGGGFMVYRGNDGKAYTLDYREKAPGRATQDMYLDSLGNVRPGLSISGHLASGVPGSVDGMAEAHKRFGKLSWAQVLQPAIDLAAKGFALTERDALGLNRIKGDLTTINPGKTYFLKNTNPADTLKWQKGEIMVQADLARTLQRIQSQGRAGFYEGETARLLAEEMKRGNGLITEDDLKDYHSVWRDPIQATYKNYNVITMPPTSSGGVALVQLMRFTEPYPLRKWGWNRDSTVQVMVEAERRVYADRAKFLGDPDFVKVPSDTLMNVDYLKSRWTDFSFAKATDSKNVRGGTIPGYESLETTHFSVVDKAGNAVSITTTLNGGYGSRVVVGGAGFFMNNEMDDFSVKPGVPNMFGLIGNQANAIAPQKRMLSSMTPTILEKDGKLFMVVGTPGGSTIITSVYQTILNVIEHGMSMQQAVNALKFHHQWLPDKTIFENGAFSDATVQNLQNRGYMLEKLTNTLGRMDCVLIRPDGSYEGASDPRADNTARGY